ncbi:CG13002 [Drosophila busckii]|uniref:CG13002 n=1 Tax=Drosophila busckii TaxID=30019 RepID=A0A0M4ETM0_DROBS|nr:uncharacterized protein LOC108604947 [Drosophila busckii]ALC48272.1 CG13002 [Drosophila busckii]
MSLGQVLHLLLAAVLLLQRVQSANFDIILDERGLLSDCSPEDDAGNLRMHEFLDISRLSTEFDEDLETMYFNGDVIVRRDLAALQEPVKLQLAVYRRQRSAWQPTLVSIKRDDFCKSMHNPFEFWYIYIATRLTAAERECPPKLGHVYQLRNISNRMYIGNIPDFDIDGDLKCVVHFTQGPYKTCMSIYLTVYKH